LLLKLSTLKVHIQTYPGAGKKSLYHTKITPHVADIEWHFHFEGRGPKPEEAKN